MAHAAANSCLKPYLSHTRYGVRGDRRVRRIIFGYNPILELLPKSPKICAAGLAAADGYDQLRAMIDPHRRRTASSSYQKVRSAAGRWSMFRSSAPASEDAIEEARYNDIAIESAARMLLNRYGVVLRDLLAFESNIPRWGVLLRMLHRLEDRGRFVAAAL